MHTGQICYGYSTANLCAENLQHKWMRFEEIYTCRGNNPIFLLQIYCTFDMDFAHWFQWGSQNLQQIGNESLVLRIILRKSRRSTTAISAATNLHQFRSKIRTIWCGFVLADLLAEMLQTVPKREPLLRTYRGNRRTPAINQGRKLLQKAANWL